MGDGDDQPPEAAPRGRAALKKPARTGGAGASAGRRRATRSAAAGAAQHRRLAALLEITTKIGALAPTDVLLARIADEAAGLLEVDNAGFRLVEGDELVLAGLAGTARETMIRPRLRIGESLSGRVVTEGRSLMLPLDEAADTLIPEHLAADRRLGYTWFLGVPLPAGGRTIGALTFRARRPFTAGDRDLAEAFAAQAAIALEHARLHEATERARREAEARARRLTALTAVTRLMTSVRATIDRPGGRSLLEPSGVVRGREGTPATSPHWRGDLFDAVAEAATTLFGAKVTDVWIADRRAGVLRACGRHAIDAATARAVMEFPEIPLGRGVVGSIFDSGRPEHIPDVQEEPRWDNQRLARDLGLHAYVGLPLIAGERAVGVLSVLFADRRPWGPEDQEVAALLAHQAAIAIDSANLYEAVDERARRLRTLARLNQLVSSSLDTGEVLSAIARAAAEIVRAPFVAFWIADHASGTLSIGAFSEDRAVDDFRVTRLRIDQGAIGWVATERRPLDIPDIFADGRFAAVDWARVQGFRSFHGVPIVLDGQLLGVVALIGREPFRFGPDDHELLDTFVGQAAVAMRNARLYREAQEHASETRRRLDQTAALLEVAEILSSTLDSRQLLKRVAIKVAQVCRADRCSVELWDGDRVVPLMSQFADGRRRPDLWEAFRSLPPHRPRDVPAHARAIESRRPVVIDDTAGTDLIPREWVERFGLESFMVVPLIRQDRAIGVIHLDHCERVTPWEPWQVDLAMTIAGQLALAIENTRLYEEVRARLRDTTTLLAIGQVLAQPGPPGETMRRVARELCRAVGADTAGVHFLDERRESLVPYAGYHVPPELLRLLLGRPMHLDRFPALAAVWGAGRAAWSPDPHGDPRFDQEWLEGLPPHSVVFAPAIARGEAMGALFLIWWRTGREFTPAETGLVEAVASQVGLAMENAELSRQTQVKLKEAEALLSVSRALASTLDLEPLMRHFLRRLVQAVEADSAGVLMLDESRQRLAAVAGYHVPPRYLEAFRAMRLSVVDDPFYAEAVRTRRPVFSSDALDDPRLPESIRATTPHRSQLFVPIVVGERMVGGFALLWWDRARRFSESEVALMEAIANQAGAAIENARLFQENRRQVEELSILHELSRAVTGQLDRAALLDAVQAQVARVLDAGNMLVVLRGETGQALDLAFRVVDGVRDGATPRPHPVPSSGLVPIVLRTGGPIRTDDYVEECRRRGIEPVATGARLRHWLGVPMKAGDAVIGALVLRHGARAFTAADERLLGNIADLAALALRSASLFEGRARAYRDLAAAQDQLVRTEKLRALGEMASGVAHDFNNLLAAILGRAQLLLQRVEEPKLRQWLQVIERASIDGAQTVRRLQEFTRIRRDEPLVAVDLNEVARDALDITQSRWRDEARSRGVTIEVRTALADVPEVAGDAAELREALTNLILNAVDAMPHGGSLALASAVVGDGVELTVSDTGVGMPESVRGRIFDPFFTTKGPRGTGLGLSITYGILSRHGALVTVESEEGRGTVFRLRFPFSERREPREAPPAPPAVPPAAPLHCLVIDDDVAVGGVVADMIQASGHRAVLVHDGADGIARFRAEPFDVVFTDLAMPGVSGWDVARAVKAGAPDVPVFLVTGFGVELAEEERASHGVDAVLVKPLRIHDVLEALARAERQRAQRP